MPVWPWVVTQAPPPGATATGVHYHWRAAVTAQRRRSVPSDQGRGAVPGQTLAPLELPEQIDVCLHPCIPFGDGRARHGPDLIPY